MTSSAQQQRSLAATGCPMAFDALTRQLYATDASIYQIEPAGVAFPRSASEAAAVMRAAADASIPLIPRGAGTGLVGGAIGDGLIVEFARYHRQITHLDLERRIVRIGPGVVLDQLNTYLKPHGFCFGPDVATSSRATLGGMIANNSSGSHVLAYGTTADHVESLEILLADGRIEQIGREHDTLNRERELVNRLVCKHAGEIAQRMPPGILKRWPGYGLDRYLREPGNLSDLISGSEGTLAAITSADLRIVPLPRQKGLGLLFFASVAEAMQATVELLDLEPSAIEHVDRILFDQTKGQLAFQSARDLLQLDAKPCESILLVEFFDDHVADRLGQLAARRFGLRTMVLQTAREMTLVWALRKAGLSLLTGRKGAAKPATGVEDTAVRPQQLPDYVASLEKLFKPLELEVCYYGHAATGLLHVRPVLDLHKAEDVKKLRWIAQEISALVRQFKGSLAAEHGVGIARTEFMPEQLGPELMEVHRQIKAAFDPDHRLNPGKIFDRERFKMDEHLRTGADDSLQIPFSQTLAFAAKDGSFTGNLEQCNGCGGCRKDTPTMCPTFLVTGDEAMSTRGRANTIRAALAHRLGGGDPLIAEGLVEALGHCLSCKACTAECPSNVNMALLKAELLHARHQRYGLPLLERVLSSADWLGWFGSRFPGLANAALRQPGLRRWLARSFGITDRRPLPAYARERFDRWFEEWSASERPSERGHVSKNKIRGAVLLWDDTFVRYHEPHIGQAAVRVLAAAGYDVRLPQGRRCCGRPAFSQGHLARAARLGRHNLRLLQSLPESMPILFLEPSCYAMFAEDYRELRLPGAEQIARRCYLFEQFVDDLLQREPEALQFRSLPGHIAIHAHCHAKALVHIACLERLAGRVPESTVTLLETGCCGMAGAFGVLESKYDLSVQVAQPLVEKIQKQPPGSVIIASGTSCRHQIDHLTAAQPLHMAELLARALPPQ